MRFEKKLLEEMGQEKIDKILLKSAARQVFREAQRAIDNYIGNITIERKDIKAKKQFAFDVILKNLSKMKKDIY
jgi:hypothetical protein